jgi:hypothetical protein
MLRRDQCPPALQRELKTRRPSSVEVTINAVLGLSWLLGGLVLALAALVLIPR